MNFYNFERSLKLDNTDLTYLARTDVPVSSALVCGRVGKSRPHHNISAMYTRHTFPAIGSAIPQHNIPYHTTTCHTVPFQAAMLSHQQGSVVERATARNWWLFPTSSLPAFLLLRPNQHIIIIIDSDSDSGINIDNNHNYNYNTTTTIKQPQQQKLVAFSTYILKLLFLINICLLLALSSEGGYRPLCVTFESDAPDRKL